MTWNRDFGQLQNDGTGVAHSFRTDLDHSIPQTCQRPMGDGCWQCQRAQEIGQIVGQRMKLKPDCIGRKALAGKPCPFESVFAFLDVLLCCSSSVVELKHPLISNRQGCDNKPTFSGKLNLRLLWPAITVLIHRTSAPSLGEPSSQLGDRPKDKQRKTAGCGITNCQRFKIYDHLPIIC